MAERKSIFGWGMYDFANTIFSALFITVYFPLFVVVKGGSAFQVGLVFSLALLFSALLVPYLGAIVDRVGMKKRFLFVSTVLCCLATFLVGYMGLTLALVFGVLAVFFFNASLDVYDALLKDVSSFKNRGYISGIGTALGYGGTLLSVLVAYIVGFQYGFETLEGMQVVFVFTAILFFVFSLFTFALVKEKKISRKLDSEVYGEAFGSVIDTIKGLKKYKQVWLFLLASLLYVDGANTAIIFLFLFGRDQLGFTVFNFLPLYAAMAITAAVGSLIVGKISDKSGYKKSLLWLLFLWCLLILILFFNTSYITFVFVGLIGGALLGGLWTVTRPLLIQLAPKKKVAELLGYQGLTEKFGGFLGPVVFGFVASAVGFREALLVVLVLFLLGLGVLSRVRAS